MKHISEIDVNEWLEIAQSKVSKTFDLEFQTIGKWNETAGQYEILSFQPNETPTFQYDFWKYEEAQTPTGINLGVYEIKLLNTKQNNGKVFHFEVSAYFNTFDKYEKLFISTKRLEDNKYLKAYRFSFLNK